MKNGIKIIRKSEQATQTVFVPEEIIQINRLNARIQRNVEAQEKALAAEREEKARQLRMEEARARKQEKVLKTCHILSLACAGAWMAAAAGLMTPVLAVLIGLPCLCGICFQAGILKGEVSR
jgi:Na+/phosphate symporter